MKDGVCTRCGGEEVYGAQQGLQLTGHHDVTLQGHIEEGFRGVRPHHRTRGVYQYVCASCGHLELYLLDPVAIDWIRSNWVRVVKRG